MMRALRVARDSSAMISRTVAEGRGCPAGACSAVDQARSDLGIKLVSQRPFAQKVRSQGTALRRQRFRIQVTAQLIYSLYAYRHVSVSRGGRGKRATHTTRMPG